MTLTEIIRRLEQQSHNDMVYVAEDDTRQQLIDDLRLLREQLHCVTGVTWVELIE